MLALVLLFHTSAFWEETEMIIRFASSLAAVASVAVHAPALGSSPDDDRARNQLPDFYYLAGDEPGALVILVSTGVGVSPYRAIGNTDQDRRTIDNLRPETPYNCTWSAKAAECNSGPDILLGCGYPYYRVWVQGVSCSPALASPR